MKRYVLEYNYETEELLNEYNSVSEAAKNNNIRSSVISRCCLNELFNLNGKYYRYKENNFGKSIKLRTFKKVVLIENNDIIIFDSLKDCGSYLKCSPNCVIDNCKSEYIITYELYYKKDWDKRNGVRKIKKIDKKCKSVYVKNILTSEVTNYSSIVDTSNKLNINRKVIEMSIKKCGVYKKKYQFSHNNSFPIIIKYKKDTSLPKFINSNPDYYLYSLLDPEKEGKFNYEDICFLYEPFYIGKGKNKRTEQHFYNSRLSIRNSKNSKIKSLMKKGLNVITTILHNNLSEQLSYEKEIAYIKMIGRKDLNLGPLTNLTDGGEGVSNLQFKLRKKVEKIDINTNEVLNEYESMTEAANIHGISTAHICGCCKGKRKTCLGYIWRYKIIIENG